MKKVRRYWTQYAVTAFQSVAVEFNLLAGMGVDVTIWIWQYKPEIINRLEDQVWGNVIALNLSKIPSRKKYNCVSCASCVLSNFSQMANVPNICTFTIYNTHTSTYECGAFEWYYATFVLHNVMKLPGLPVIFSTSITLHLNAIASP